MDVLAVFVFSLLAVFPVLAACWVIIFARRFAAIRRLSWIAVMPALERTGQEDVSHALKILISKLAGPLRVAGFEPVESVHAPHFAGFGTWTQVLFVNPDTGERASFVDASAPDTCHVVNLLLAWEIPGQNPVVTGLESGPLHFDAELSGVFEVLLDRHRTAVESARLQSSEPFSKGAAPTTDQAFEWLQKRAALVAEDHARRIGYRKNGQGDRYVAPFWLVARAAVAIRRKRKAIPKRAFEPLPVNERRAEDSVPTP